MCRPSNGTRDILRSRGGELQATPFGSSGDRPQPADYDNDGKSEAAAFRPSEGKWSFRFSASESWGIASSRH